ncbi:PucR family transcriptional regulator [Nocardioides sp.]|uniref:PucR family transcriptional regulator n=1 Tax=Nocardioides sp. TaxID=35761 RepID=UPI003515CCC1
MSTSAVTRPQLEPTDPRVVAVCQQLLLDIDGLTERVAHLIRAEEEIYLTAVTFEQLVESVRPNLIGLLESLMLDAPGSMAPPRRTGRTRAGQGVPLACVLHAYRLGALQIWNEVVVMCDDPEVGRALLASASKLWTALDVYSQELAAAYRDVETEQILRDARQREAALAAIVSGVAPQGRTLGELAGALRLPHVGQLVVVACDPLGGEEEREDSTTANLERALSSLGVRSAWRSEPDCELGIIALTRAYRLDRLTDHLGTLALGRVGLSRIYESLLETPAAAVQARLARQVALAGSGTVTRFDQARIPALLHASPDLAVDLAREVLGPVLDLPGDEQDLLLGTLRAWFDAGGAAEATGKLLHCHPNTVRYRLGKLTSLTGADLRLPADLVRLSLALESHRLLLETERRAAR